MLSVFERRYPILELLLFPALVQGKSAPLSLVKAINAANHSDAELIIIARGGGSAEDLCAFNDETLAREIHACKIPVVSAVGHEIDFTIADFAADLRAPAPSAAAELVTPDLSDLPSALDNMLADLRRRINDKLTHKLREIEAVEKLINALNPEKVFERGYAAVFSGDGKAVRKSQNVKIGEELSVKLAEGELTVVVKEKE
jgi:exodeoxyribonuclease VII large subunit